MPAIIVRKLQKRSLCNGNGAITRYTYDHKGRMVSKTDALGHTTSYEYLNGLLTKTTDANGNTTAYTYDAHGNMASMTDALGNTTLYHYNTKGNLLSMTFADGTTIRYTYDAMGRQTSMTDPLGNVIKYRYDALGNLTQTRLPDDTVQTASTGCHTRPVHFFLLEKFSDHVQKAVSCTLLLMTVVVKVPCIPSRPPKHDPLLTCCPRREDL